ncbi:MAG: DUF3990 domain-containing protein, partial [Thermoguttaceae bacterium]|nr:DUF3990 domain-containing protein [Thermoguttaceae bacterium]
MIVYHGSVLEIQTPDIKYSKAYLDFGKGFYTTSIATQAERWAIRKAGRYRDVTPRVNVYELNDSFEEYKTLTFHEPDDDEAWLDFVCSCREGKDECQKYDIIIGGVADDEVIRAVDFFRRGVWDKQRTLRELKYFKRNDQIVFVNQAILEKL